MKRTILWMAAVIVVGLTSSHVIRSQSLDETVSRTSAGEWQLTWRSVTDGEYLVQRSTDLRLWTDVETVVATGETTTFVDDGAPVAAQVYWRLRYESGSGTVLITPFSIIELVMVDAGGEPVAAGTADANWRITWESIKGGLYKVQRSGDARDWEDVATVTATDDTTSYVDAGAPTLPRLLWRVIGLSVDSGPVDISEITPQFSGGGGGSSAALSVVIDSEEPVESVVFFDGDTPLGTAVPGPGGVYSFALEWDPAAPRVVELSVRVNPASGEPVQTEPVALLVADPARYVPLDADGAPQFGAFVPVGEDGGLEAFAFYPEGLDAPAGGTGAHFVFAAGAVPVAGGAEIDTGGGGAQFFRGADDPQPLPSRPGTRRVDLAVVDAAAVDAEFVPPPGEGVTLRFGTVEVDWQGGALGSDGWAALQVRPPLGNFVLPSQLLNAQIGADPITGELYLIICYHGAWSPASGGTTFRIPEADPLKIYIGGFGGIRAHGTVEALFPDGATLRGSVSWRDPVFEISLEGRGFTIPAAGKLKDLAPTTPMAAVAIGDSDAELDAAADALLAYQNIYRSVSVSGLKEADAGAAGGAVPSPAATPTETAGAVLEGWGWRLRSWATDRPGENLDAESRGQLARAVAGAGKTAEAASSPGVPLKLLRDVLMVRGNRPRARPTGWRAGDGAGGCRGALLRGL